MLTVTSLGLQRLGVIEIFTGINEELPEDKQKMLLAWQLFLCSFLLLGMTFCMLEQLFNFTGQVKTSYFPEELVSIVQLMADMAKFQNC